MRDRGARQQRPHRSITEMKCKRIIGSLLAVGTRKPVLVDVPDLAATVYAYGSKIDECNMMLRGDSSESQSNSSDGGMLSPNGVQREQNDQECTSDDRE